MDKNLFLKCIGTLPDLKNSGFFSGNFFFNQYGDNHPIRVGCEYSDTPINNGTTPGSRYLYMIEIFKEKPTLEHDVSGEIGNKRIFYGYLPDFPLIKNLIENENPAATWADENVVHTLVNTMPKKKEIRDLSDLPGLYIFQDASKDERLMSFLNTLLSEKARHGVLPLFNFIEHLPETAGRWGLVTAFLYYEGFNIENKTHLVSNIQGNYTTDNASYLNVRLRFAYSVSPASLVAENIIKNEKDDKFLVLYRYNEKEKYSIKVFNNETTLDAKKYRKYMELLFSETIEKLKKYSCIEESLKFISAFRV